MDFIFLSAAGSLIQLTIQCLCGDCLRLFIDLAGAGATGKALAFFQMLNVGNNSRVNKSKIIWFNNMNSFLYIAVFCQHFVKTEEAKKVPLRWLKYEEIDVVVTFECVNAIFFHWMYKMKFSCYQESSVIHGKFLHRWPKRNMGHLWRNLIIVFFFLKNFRWDIANVFWVVLF